VPTRVAFPVNFTFVPILLVRIWGAFRVEKLPPEEGVANDTEFPNGERVKTFVVEL
jgi:hypothetical protein